MSHPMTGRAAYAAWTAALASTLLALAGCSSSAPAPSSASSGAPSGGASAGANTDPAAAGSPLNAKVAYLSASSANTWLQASRVQMGKVAAANGVTITDFDAQFKPGVQSGQVQDVIAAGTYQGIVIAALDGAAIIPDLQAAMAKGIKVVLINQVVGPRLDTADPQFPGPSASVLVPPLRSGTLLGQLTLKACADKSPCRVLYFYGIKGIPVDTALRQGFDTATATNPTIKVVAEGEGKYLGPDTAMNATRDILQKTPDFDVVVGSDQAIQGVELALKDAGKLSSVRLIGYGGSNPAITAVKAGTWFGDIHGAPGTEGRLAMTAMVDALRNGKSSGGIDPLKDFPGGGLITKDNVGQITPEWNG